MAARPGSADLIPFRTKLEARRPLCWRVLSFGVHARFIPKAITITKVCNKVASPGVALLMKSNYDSRQSSTGDWEVFLTTTGENASIGGVPLSALDRVTANGVVGLLNKKIIRADDSVKQAIGGKTGHRSGV